MKDWFPLTNYEFYAYVAAGMLLIASIDYSLAGEILINRTEWTVVQVVFWTVVAYFGGQLVAAPSAGLLEHLLARRYLHPPVDIQLGLKPRRMRERVAAALFAPREYAPLASEIQGAILLKARTALSVAGETAIQSEAVYTVAFPVARRNSDCVSRLDQFINLYGASRNISFVALISAGALEYRYYHDPSTRTGWLIVVAVVFVVGMFGRFLKFYAAYSAEVLRSYISAE